MKKRYLIIGLLASSLSSTQSYSQRKLSHTDVQLVFSYYGQDNNHSAVTGGTGTEQLTVYAQSLGLDYVRDSLSSLHYDIGFDVITSASTDNIDFAISSASKVDTRIHTTVGYSHYLRDKKTIVGGGFAFSVESDYLSLGPSASVRSLSKNGSREVSVTLETYFDDLRYGWLSDGAAKNLVYPFELRNREWFSIYRRQSYNLIFGINQTINRKMTLGIFPSIVYQSGLLSTPFHRAYFEGGDLRVENLPQRRWKFPLGVQFNSFMGTRWILRTYYRFYADDFGLKSQTLSLEAPVKLSRVITLTPALRLYEQNAADYFRPYRKHDPGKEFYTSDYDLSGFSSYKAGLSFRYAPYAFRNRTTLNALELRYAFYQRSDGMTANMITLFINYDKVK